MNNYLHITLFNYLVNSERKVRAQPFAFLSNGIFAANGSSKRKSARLKFRNKPYTNTLYTI